MTAEEQQQRPRKEDIKNVILQSSSSSDPFSVVEPILWTLLSVCPVFSLFMWERGNSINTNNGDNNANNSMFLKERWTMCVATALQSLVMLVQTIRQTQQQRCEDQTNNDSSHHRTTILWRQQQQQQQQQQHRNKDPQGLCSIVIVPLLLQSMSLYNDYWLWYAKLASLLYVMVIFTTNNKQDMLIPYFQRNNHNRLYSHAMDFLFICTVVGLVVMGSGGGETEVLDFTSYTSWRYILQNSMVVCTMALVFPSIIQTCKAFQQVFTMGEWCIVSSLGSIAITELILLIIDFTHLRRTNHDDDDDDHILTTPFVPPPIHACISLTGILGSVLGCLIASYVPPKLWIPKILVLVFTPFVIIEGTLYSLSPHYCYNNNEWNNNSTIIGRIIPKSVQWLVSFLLEKETDSNHNDDSSQIYQYLPSYWLQYRYQWLLYWIFILSIAIPYAPRSSTTTKTIHNKDANYLPISSVVARRKWFHGVAVLLFGPVTWYSPQLMSLSYAIALAALFVLEHVRLSFRIPMIDDFYTAFLDFDKDTTITTTTATTPTVGSLNANSSSSKYKEAQHSYQPPPPPQIVVTHTLLILGCAMPLWISEMIQLGHATLEEAPIITASLSSSCSSFFILLVQLWGVLSLGVGDAMGALVGKTIGKTYWNPHRKSGRTLEGSFAMWMSMSIICCYWSIQEKDGTQQLEILPWLAAVTGVTLIEAWTHQIDNLILPLSGVIILLTFQPAI